jgi:hypothetical protein
VVIGDVDPSAVFDLARTILAPLLGQKLQNKNQT